MSSIDPTGTGTVVRKWTPDKAVVAAVLTFLSTLAVALDPAADKHPVTVTEWAFIVITSAITAGAVWVKANRPAGVEVDR